MNDQIEKTEQTEQTTSVPEETKETAPEVKNEAPKSKNFLIVAGLVLVAVIGVGIYLQQSDQSVDGLSLLSSDTNGTLGTDYPDVVAVVNGVEVTGSELKQSVANTVQLAQQQGYDTSDPTIQAEIESQSMTVLVNTKLLLQEATEQGLVVPDEQVSEQIATIEAQLGGAEAFQAEIDALGLTMEEVREDIREQLLVDLYVQQNEATASVEVTDEEVAEFHASLVAEGQQVPPLDDVAAQIKEQLTAQKQQEAVGVLIESLRAEAEIEVNLE